MLGAASVVVLRALYFGCILALIGGVTMLRLTTGTDVASVTARQVSRLERWTVVALGPILLFRLIEQSAAFADPGQSWTALAPVILRHTPWGLGWALAVLGTLVIGWEALRRGGPHAWHIAAGTLGLVLSLPLSGHAIGAERYTTATIIADILHITGAGLWAGSLGLVVALLRGTTNGAAVSTVIERFSPLALSSAAVLALSGTFAAWQHVGTWPLLIGSSYGLVLLAKLGAVGSMSLVGAYNWQVSRPALRRTGSTSQLRRLSVWEVGAALVVLLLTAVLVHLPLPGDA